MTAREQFAALVEHQLAAVLDGKTSQGQAKAAITTAGQQLAATVTAAALATFEQPCDDAVVVAMVTEVRSTTGRRWPAELVPVQRKAVSQ